MAALDLNSHGQEWPGMAGYEGLFRLGPQGGGTDGCMGPPPIRVCSGSRTLGLRAARSGGGGGATTARALSSSSSGGRGPSLPPMTAGMRASPGSASGAPAGSRSRGGRRRPTTSAVAEDNFDVNNPNEADDDEIQQIFLNTQILVFFQNPEKYAICLIFAIFVIYVRILIMHCLG